MDRIRYIKLSEVDSTNTYAKRNSSMFTDEYTVIQSARQTGGRGRVGRAFLSDNEDGAWFSVVIKPKGYTLTVDMIRMLPLLAGVSVSTVLYEIYGVKTGLKWPNDVLLNGKKLCGILCESRTVGSIIENAIIGIGINVNQKSMDPDIKDIATSLFMETHEPVSIENLIQNICGNILALYDRMKSEDMPYILGKWNEYSVMTGRQTEYTANGVTYKGISKGIDAHGRLIVTKDNDETVYLDSNEVRLHI
jgi:BirA family biotin operon repressor/biotin-[acetyl-CoA-carboxylase] ligase